MVRLNHQCVTSDHPSLALAGAQPDPAEQHEPSGRRYERWGGRPDDDVPVFSPGNPSIWPDRLCQCGLPLVTLPCLCRIRCVSSCIRQRLGVMLILERAPFTLANVFAHCVFSSFATEISQKKSSNSDHANKIIIDIILSEHYGQGVRHPVGECRIVSLEES